MDMAAWPPSLDLLAVALVRIAESGPQSRFLVCDNEQVRNDHEGGAIREQRPGLIEQSRTGQSERRTDLHWVAHKQVRAGNDQAPRRVEWRRRSAVDHDEGGDTPQRDEGTARRDEDASDLGGADTYRQDDS